MAPEWYYTSDRQQMGPVTWEELQQLAGRGLLKPQDLVWTEGMDQWVKAARQEGLFAEGTAPAPAPKPRDVEAEPPQVRRADADDDAEEIDERIRRRRRVRRKEGMAVGVKIGIAIGAGVVLLAVLLCGGLLFFYTVVKPRQNDRMRRAASDVGTPAGIASFLLHDSGNDNHLPGERSRLAQRVLLQ